MLGFLFLDLGATAADGDGDDDVHKDFWREL